MRNNNHIIKYEDEDIPCLTLNQEIMATEGMREDDLFAWHQMTAEYYEPMAFYYWRNEY